MVMSTKCFVLSSCGRKVAPALGNSNWRKGLAEIQVTRFSVSVVLCPPSKRTQEDVKVWI